MYLEINVNSSHDNRSHHSSMFQTYNSSLPLIAVALVGAMRLPQVLEQVRVIRNNPMGQMVPMVMCLDDQKSNPVRPGALKLANLLDIKVAFVDSQVKRG